MFKIINHTEMPIKEVSSSAFCQARKKIKHSAFIELNNRACEYFYENYDYKTWNGFRLVAIDGSTVIIPKNDETANYFGTSNSGTKAKKVAMACISQAFDVLNHVIVDSNITKFQTSELERAVSHIDCLTQTDLLLFDRGYLSAWFFKYISTKKINFCARIKNQSWTEVNKAIENGKKDVLVKISLKRLAVRKKCEEHGIPNTPEEYRVIVVQLDNGEEEVLLTSLLDRKKYPARYFKALYCKRWGVEESYKEYKAGIEIENFSGKSVENIKQDYHARILMLNLTSFLIEPANEVVKEKTISNKHIYQVNRIAAFSKMKNTIILLFERVDINGIVSTLFEFFISYILPVRPGRKYKRGRQWLKKRWHISYKPIQ